MDKSHDRILKISGATLPPIIFIALFSILPLILLVIEFKPRDVRIIFEENLGIIEFTFVQALISAILVVLLGVPLSRITARRRLPKTFDVFLKVLSKIPFVIPGISMALGFMLFFGRKGLLNILLKPFGMSISILYSFPAVLLGHVFYNIPVVVYTVGTLWEKIGGEILESAKIDGASDTKILLRVEIPLLIPSILSSFLMAFTYCFTSFAVVLILGGVRYSTIEVAIYTYLRILLDFRSALALTILQMIFLAGIAVLRYTIGRNPEVFHGETLKEKMRTSDWIYLTALSFAIFAPLFLSLMGGFVERGGWKFSLDGLRYLFQRTWESVLGTNIVDVFKDTFSIALMASTISTFVALLSSRISVFHYPLFSVIAYIPATISTVTLAMGYVLLEGIFKLSEVLMISLLHATISLPMTHMILESAWRRIDPSLEDSARVDGAGTFRVFSHVQLPLMWRGLLRAFTLAMAISMGDLAGVVTLSRHTFTLSSAIYRLFSSRHVTEALALNSIMMLVVLAIFALGEILGED